jgi:hypothetical protein
MWERGLMPRNRPQIETIAISTDPTCGFFERRFKNLREFFSLSFAFARTGITICWHLTQPAVAKCHGCSDGDGKDDWLDQNQGLLETNRPPLQ